MLKTDRKKIDAFELWCWRRILKVPWTKKITNKEILEKIQLEYSLEAMIRHVNSGGGVGGGVTPPQCLENAIGIGKSLTSLGICWLDEDTFLGKLASWAS